MGALLLAACGGTVDLSVGDDTGGGGPSAGSDGKSGEAGAGVGSAGASAGKAGAGGAPAGGGGSGGSGGSGGAAGSGGPQVSTFDNVAITGSWPNRPVAREQQPGSLSYTKVVVHDRFLAESCAIGDYNLDGQPDVSSGRRWYEGPSFSVEHVFRGGHEDLPRAGLSPEISTGVSDDSADYAFDMDGDGDPDIINVANVDISDGDVPNPAPAPQASSSAYWYENPGPALVDQVEGWAAHLMHTDVRGEHHGLGDVDGDGRPELYGACKGCSPSETLGYYRGDWTDPTKPWTYQPVTRRVDFPFGGSGKLHGLGFGDVNLDGKPDLLERAGVWLDITSPVPNEVVCPAAGCGNLQVRLYGIDEPSGHLGGAHMFSFDVDGDGDGDVVSADLAHNWGISWYEQTAPGTFVKHRIVGSPNDPGSTGIWFSQPHALEVADMDGDGVPDVISGKRYLAHPDGFGDPDLFGTPVVYVLRTVRNEPNPYDGSPVTFEPYLVDMESGIGMQLAVGHANNDGILDLCVASKLGLSVYLGE